MTSPDRTVEALTRLHGRALVALAHHEVGRRGQPNDLADVTHVSRAGGRTRLHTDASDLPDPVRHAVVALHGDPPGASDVLADLDTLAATVKDGRSGLEALVDRSWSALLRTLADDDALAVRAAVTVPGAHRAIVTRTARPGGGADVVVSLLLDEAGRSLSSSDLPLPDRDGHVPVPWTSMDHEADPVTVGVMLDEARAQLSAD